MSTPYRIKGKTGEWEVILGLEVHAQITSNAKLFSGAPVGFGAETNQNVSFVDAGMPGMLPVINEKCIEQAVRTGLGLKAQINLHSVFDRKNYFYADLPQGYQISQFLDPIVGKGSLEITLKDGTTREIGITRLHLEQDAGKSLHEHSPKYSFIDLNRSGVALMEIVSEPDMRSPEEAAAYFKKLRTILLYLDTCDGNLEQGNMRADVNVSVRRPGEPFGTRCEIKNMNSVRFIMKAIEFEATRQVEILEAGGTIDQETRLFDAGTGETRTMRSKEDAHDYRYFPDPDLLPLVITQEFVDAIKASLPELPDEKKQRYVEKMGLSAYDAGVISAEKEAADYFDALTAAGHDAKLAANWMTVELFARLNKLGVEITESPISAAQLSGLLALIEDNTISGKIAKTVFEKMFESGKPAKQIVDEEGLVQVTDTGAIDAAIAEVIAANPDKVAEYKSGKDKLFGFFVGQVMKATGGKANPAMLNELLKKQLG
ncbi:MAG: Asp-tRNA(Asn)/Glu-tRNA(Gln) amidotransferase GatCAB subunit B [Azospirillum brasilense]|nr:MAG: Asp-tRNA(Asn)/Glu-tRNA(Gln) amidotransferase GatCAB subunit B [Azospirillum brasilense]